MRAIAKGIVATSVCISTVALAGSAFAERVIDQQAAVSVQGAGYSAWVMENQAMAQPFTAGITGALTRADLSVAPWSSNQSNLLVEIYEMDGGVPVGSALATAAVPAADIRAMQTDRNLNTLTVNFSSPVQVNSGTQYAIVASTTAGEGYHWFMSSTDWLYQNEWSLYGDTRRRASQRVGHRQRFQLFLHLGLAPHAGGVDQTHRPPIPGPVHTNGIPGNPCLRTCQQAFFAQKRIDQRGFAGIGPSDNGDAQGDI